MQRLLLSSCLSHEHNKTYIIIHLSIDILIYWYIYIYVRKTYKHTAQCHSKDFRPCLCIAWSERGPTQWRDSLHHERLLPKVVLKASEKEHYLGGGRSCKCEVIRKHVSSCLLFPSPVDCGCHFLCNLKDIAWALTWRFQYRICSHQS